MQARKNKVIPKLSALLFESPKVGSYSKKEQNKRGNKLSLLMNSRSFPLSIQALFSATASVPAERRESEVGERTTILKAGMRRKIGKGKRSRAAPESMAMVAEV